MAAVPLSAQFSPASKSVPGSLKLLLAALLGLGLLSLAVVAIPERLLGGVSVRLVDQRGNVIVGSLVLLFGLGIGLLAALVGG